MTNEVRAHIEANGRFSTHYLENSLTDATSRPHPQLSSPPERVWPQREGALLIPEAGWDSLL